MGLWISNLLCCVVVYLLTIWQLWSKTQKELQNWNKENLEHPIGQLGSMFRKGGEYFRLKRRWTRKVKIQSCTVFCKSFPFWIVDVNNVAILSKVGVYFRLLRPPSFPPSLNWQSATEGGLHHFYLLFIDDPIRNIFFFSDLVESSRQFADKILTPHRIHCSIAPSPLCN